MRTALFTFNVKEIKKFPGKGQSGKPFCVMSCYEYYKGKDGKANYTNFDLILSEAQYDVFNRNIKPKQKIFAECSIGSYVPAGQKNRVYCFNVIKVEYGFNAPDNTDTYTHTDTSIDIPEAETGNNEDEMPF